MRQFSVVLFLAPLLVLAACAPSQTSAGQTDPQPFDPAQGERLLVNSTKILRSKQVAHLLLPQSITAQSQ